MTETNNCVYNPVFFNFDNGNYCTHNLGLYRKKEDAIRSIYDHIIESAEAYTSFISDEAIDALEEDEDEVSEDGMYANVCPETSSGLHEWCIKYTNKHHKWDYHYDKSMRICWSKEDAKGSWGWEINEMQIQ
jgi:hypothetical protein